MENNDMQIKVTKTGRIMRKLSLFEVIDKAEKEWEEPYKKGEFEYGKCVVVFKDRECNSITYVPHHIMPMPYQIKDIEPSKFDKTYRMLEETFKEHGLTIIKSKSSVYVDAPEDVKEEIKKQMKGYGYNTIGLR